MAKSANAGMAMAVDAKLPRRGGRVRNPKAALQVRLRFGRPHTSLAGDCACSPSAPCSALSRKARNTSIHLATAGSRSDAGCTMGTIRGVSSRGVAAGTQSKALQSTRLRWSDGTRVAASRLIRRTHRDSRCTFAWSPSRHDSRKSRYSR